jgi:hypothetical protein
MVKVLYDDYLEQKRLVQGESSKQAKSEEGEDPPKISSFTSFISIFFFFKYKFKLLLQENILINISLICHYLNLM